MLDTPQIVSTRARHTAVIPLIVPRTEIQQVMGPAIGEVITTLADMGVSPTGPVFSHHLRMDPEVFDFQVGVPVHSPITASGRVIAATLPAVQAAQTIYRGPYEGLGEAWGEFNAWIEAHGYKMADNLWECYVAGPETSTDPADWQTVLNRPLR